MAKDLPSRPNLEHFKKEAKALMHDMRQGGSGAKLADAQRIVAREYGFANWAKLKAHVAAVAPPAIDPVEEFKRAVLYRDPERLTELFHSYPELKSKIDEPYFAFDSQAIIQAASRGDRKTIEVLLANGADINVKTRWWAGGFTVLVNAPDLAAFLIDHGAIVDVHAAARLGMIDRVRELIAADPMLVHARGGDGQMPLHFACTIEVAEYLLAHGADIDARDIDHESTAAQYMLSDRTEVARYLVQRGGKTDVLMAAALGEVDLLSKHLDADPASVRTCVDEQSFPKQDPRAGGSIYIWVLGNHRTAHQVAKKFGHSTVLALLMDRSPAEWKLLNACLVGDEATAKAMLAGYPSFVKSLSEADLRQIENAAEDNNTEGVRLMLQCGWPVAGVRHTPLHWASWHGNSAMVRAILAYAPPLEKIDPDHNLTPIGWAMHGSEYGWHAKTGDYIGTVEALLQAGSKIPEPIFGTQAVRAVVERHRC